jgi:hypothetical protein
MCWRIGSRRLPVTIDGFAACELPLAGFAAHRTKASRRDMLQRSTTTRVSRASPFRPFCVIHEGPADVKGVGRGDWRLTVCLGARGGCDRSEIVGVPGLCPGLVAWWPGEPGPGRAPGVVARSARRGWGRLPRLGGSGWRFGGGDGALGVGRRFAECVPAGRRLQSSIRSCGADQSVVRCSGA